jgi:hypothetical protein
MWKQLGGNSSGIPNFAPRDGLRRTKYIVHSYQNLILSAMLHSPYLDFLTETSSDADPLNFGADP